MVVEQGGWLVEGENVGSYSVKCYALSGRSFCRLGLAALHFKVVHVCCQVRHPWQ